MLQYSRKRKLPPSTLLQLLNMSKTSYILFIYEIPQLPKSSIILTRCIIVIRSTKSEKYKLMKTNHAISRLTQKLLLPTNIHTAQNKTFPLIITNAPFYVINQTLHADLQMKTIVYSIQNLQYRAANLSAGRGFVLKLWPKRLTSSERCRPVRISL